MADEAVEKAILELLDTRADGKTACPSEIARALAGPDGRWRERMADVRRSADELAGAGRIVVTQRGRGVSALNAIGPIRLGKKPR